MECCILGFVLTARPVVVIWDAFSLVYQSDYSVGNGGQIFASPSQSGGVNRPSQSYYTRGSVRGMARGGKALAQTFRSSGWQRGIVCLLLLLCVSSPHPTLCRRARPVKREFFFLQPQSVYVWSFPYFGVMTFSSSIFVNWLNLNWGFLKLVSDYRRILHVSNSSQGLWSPPLCS